MGQPCPFPSANKQTTKTRTKTMKARYTIEVEMKDGFSPMTERRIETAVWDSAPTTGAIRSVSVRRGDLKENVKALDIFGLAQRGRDNWFLLDYFNSHTKAVNAVKRATVNSLKAFKKDMEYAVFHYNPKTSVWEKCE